MGKLVHALSTLHSLALDFPRQLHHIAVWGSILVWFIFLAAYSHVWPTFPIAEVMVGIDRALYGSVIFYGICVLVPSLAMLPDLLKTM